MVIDKDVVEFEWDKGNLGKNQKHGVSETEAEEVFFDPHKRTFKDAVHSGKERRLRIIGMNKKGKLLFVVFTKRKQRIRIISARSLNRKEKYLYEETI